MRPALYARVSGEEQRERQTIQTQLAYGEQYAKLHGREWVRVYADDGISGTVPVERRPEGARLLQDARAGVWDTLHVYRLDRLGRSLLLILQTLETLEGHGCALRSLTEPFDTSSAFGRAMLSVLGIFAELERLAIRERTMAGHARHTENGGWCGGRPPLGYRLTGEPGHRALEVEPAEAEMVRRLYALYLDGLTTVQIAGLLNAEGVPTRDALRYHDGSRWSDATVLRMLKNPVYRGERLWRKRRTQAGRVERAPEDYHLRGPAPALVSAETWEAAQAQNRRNTAGASRNARHVYQLRGLIRCELCGYGCAGQGGERFRYYACGGKDRQRTGRDACCPSKMLPADLLEAAVWQALEEFAARPGVAEAALRRAFHGQAETGPDPAEAAGVERLLRQQAEGRARVVSLLRRGLITEGEAESDLRQSTLETEGLRARQEGLFTQEVAARGAEERLVRALTLLRDLPGALAAAQAPEDRQALMRGYVRRVTAGLEPGEGRKVARVEAVYVFGELEIPALVSC